MAIKDKDNIELGDLETPNLPAIIGELEDARTDARNFYGRMQQAKSWWNSWWPGQTVDGRKNLDAIIQADAADASLTDDENCFPWQGAADSRIRTVATLIRDHVMVSEYAFFKSKIQATKFRPMNNPGETTKATRVLRWRLYVHMWSELIREVPRVFNWFHGYGLGLMGIGWERARRLDYVDLSLPTLDEIMQAQAGQQGDGQDNWLWLMDAIMDPNQEDQLVTLVQQLSPIVSRPEARKIVVDLREVRTAKLPVAYPFTNKPVWYAMKPTVDCLFPGETVDIQQARWYCDQHEWLSETELRDREETEGYDPEFVERAIEVAKGEAADPTQVDQNDNIRPPIGRKKLIQMYHFHYRATIDGTPVQLTTSLNPLVKAERGGNYLYAKHGPCYYDHGFYPVVTWARLAEGRRLYDAVGIAEEAYTDEQDIKRQQDGLSDRTSLINKPPMIVPQSKVGAVKGAYGPGKILGVGRAREVEWGPLPPTDGTPVQVMEAVTLRLDNRYPLFGMELDPAKKDLYREKIARDTLGPTMLAIEQTFQLMQQYEDDQEIAKVAGDLATPFHVNKEEIQGRHNITATIDMQMLDEGYNEKKFALIGQALAFKQEGLLFDMAIEAIDPDAAELIKQSETSPAAMEKEKDDELNAVSRAFNGIESPLPMFANHQLRLQTMLQATLQSQNPAMKVRLQSNPDAVAILTNRAKFFMNQIQQYEQNPGIGRALQTRTFAGKQAPELTMSSPGAAGAPAATGGGGY